MTEPYSAKQGPEIDINPTHVPAPPPLEDAHASGSTDGQGEGSAPEHDINP